MNRHLFKVAFMNVLNDLEQPIFNAGDLAAMLQLSYRLCTCQPTAQARLTAMTQGLKQILRAESACIFESRGPSSGRMTELHRDNWRDWHTDELSAQLNGRKLSEVTHACINLVWQPRTVAAKPALRWHCLVSCLPAGVGYLLTIAFARRAALFTTRESLLLRSFQASPIIDFISQRISSVPTAQLSGRQQEVLTAMLRGLSEKQIAGALQLSPHTVHVYIKALYRRYNVNSRAELLSLSIDPIAKLGIGSGTVG
jgi:DNA-binding CsgD family transcriptional regulator